MAAEAGHAPMLARLSLRVTDEFRDRVDQAASDCELPPADWLREVIAGALDVHEERERLRQAEYAPDPPGQPEYAQELDAELATRTAETVPPEEPPLPTDADYEERVLAEAARLRGERPRRSQGRPRPAGATRMPDSARLAQQANMNIRGTGATGRSVGPPR